MSHFEHSEKSSNFKTNHCYYFEDFSFASHIRNDLIEFETHLSYGTKKFTVTLVLTVDSSVNVKGTSKLPFI